MKKTSSPSLWGEHRDLSLNVRPVFRWAGGKQRWLSTNSRVLPAFEGQYFEPFLGGGSVFFHLVRRETRPFEAWLGDSNLQLIRAYSDLKSEVDSVVEGVRTLDAAYQAAHDKRAFYEKIREAFNRSLPQSNTADFIFLNSTCWNGLWRTNSSGWFNVPFGAPKSEDVLPNEVELRSASAALQHARLRASSWQNLVSAAGRGDFVFMDPPYYSDSLNRSSAKYGSDSWGYEKHAALADEVVELQSRGVTFVLTNSNEPEMIELYESHGLSVAEILVPRAINSKTDERQAVGELIVTNSNLSPNPGKETAEVLDLDIFLRARARKQTE